MDVNLVPLKIFQGLWPHFDDIGLILMHVLMWKQKTLPSSRSREIGSIAKF